MTSALFVGSSMLLAAKVEPAPGDVSIVGAIGLSLALYLGFRLLRIITKDDNGEKKK